MSVPGIGPIISSAMVAAIGTGDAFTNRRLAGLVPKQIWTGDRTILGKISKRGNRYLRVSNPLTCRGLREDEKRDGGSVFPAHASTGDPDGPLRPDR